MVKSFLRGAAFAIALGCGVAAPAAAQAIDVPVEQQLDTMLARAVVLHEAGDLMGAIQYYEAALAIAPDRADIRSNLGAAHVGLGHYAEAIAEYTKALAGQDDPSIRLNLALALYKSGRTGDAIPEFQRVLQANPGNAQAALLLADCLLQMGRDQDVIDLLTPRDAAFVDDLAYAYLLGTALLKQGETEKGQVLIDRIFKKGESAEGHLLMGMAYLNKRDYVSASTELAKAIAINPALNSVQVLYGRALLGTGDREQAARAFRAAVDQQPDNFDANLQLGTLTRLDQKYDQALMYLKRAATARPDDVAVRHALAATYLGLGDPQKSCELLEGVIKDVPDLVDAHVLLATTYYRLKRKEDGDRERAIIDRLTAQNQAKQPGAQRSDELERQAPAAGAPSPPPDSSPKP